MKTSLITALAAFALVAGTAAARPDVPGGQPCSRSAASRELVRVNLGEGGHVAQLICGDFTGDGTPDMAVSAATPGTAGVIGWAIFKGELGGWSLRWKRPRAYRPQLVRLGRDVLEVVPIYRRGDPNCCPSGGYRDTIFRWNGSRFVAVFSWRQG